MRITNPIARKPKESRSPRWWDSGPSESREILQQMKLERLKSSVQVQSQQAAAQPATATQKPQQSSKIDRLTLYRLSKPTLVGCHNESLLEPISRQVQTIRACGIQVYSVSRLEGLLVAIAGELEASFQIASDIWLDFSQVQRLSKSLNLPSSEVLESVFYHEVGHIEDSTEAGAWANALRLWEKFGQCPLASLQAVAQLSLKSHGFFS